MHTHEYWLGYADATDDQLRHLREMLDLEPKLIKLYMKVESLLQVLDAGESGAGVISTTEILSMVRELITVLDPDWGEGGG
jgi:hypothetical protein